MLVDGTTTDVKSSSFVSLIQDIVTCPLNVSLFILCSFLLYAFIRPFLRQSTPKPLIPKLRKRDFTLEELKPFSGDGPEKRILIAVNGNVFDVTNNGQGYYGKGAPYSDFAGKDASRALACFNVEQACIQYGYDDLSDLSPVQMNNLREWELQFRDLYDLVGRLLKPGETHCIYEGDDDETAAAWQEDDDKTKYE